MIVIVTLNHKLNGPPFINGNPVITENTKWPWMKRLQETFLGLMKGQLLLTRGGEVR